MHDRDVECSATIDRSGIANGFCELLRRGADEIGSGDAGKVMLERFDAASLGDAAGDPVDAVEGGERLRGGVRVGRLGVIDERDGPDAADFLHAVSKSGKAVK